MTKPVRPAGAASAAASPPAPAPRGDGRRVALVCSRFHEDVTSALLAGARSALRDAGVRDEHVLVAWVPGSFELPLVCRRIAATARFDAVVALGLVLRGETDHYDHVCRAAADGILRAGLETDVPVVFGVLTCDTLEQATARAGGVHGNKGADVALDALRTCDVLDEVSGASR